MARILVLYGTTDGQTAKIAHAIGTTLHEQCRDVDVVNANDAAPEPRDYDGVIVAASVHAGGYQKSVRKWVRAHAGELSGPHAAFVSVCLGVLQHDPKVDLELKAIRDKFLGETGWSPGTIKIVAGALPYTHYNWLKRLVMKRIVRKAGGDTDTTRDYEYTDWNDLRIFAETFARNIAGELSSVEAHSEARVEVA